MDGAKDRFGHLAKPMLPPSLLGERRLITESQESTQTATKENLRDSQGKALMGIGCIVERQTAEGRAYGVPRQNNEVPARWKAEPVFGGIDCSHRPFHTAHSVSGSPTGSNIAFSASPVTNTGPTRDSIG